MAHITYVCQPAAFIESMYVRDDHRRRGVARMMVERLLDDASRAGCYKVQLLTHKCHAADGAHALTAHSGSRPRPRAFACTSTGPGVARRPTEPRRPTAQSWIATVNRPIENWKNVPDLWGCGRRPPDA